MAQQKSAVEAAEIGGSANALADWLNQIAAVLHEGLIRRVNELANTPADWLTLLQDMHAAGRSPALTVVYALAAALGGGIALVVARHSLARFAQRFGRLAPAALAIFLAALAVVLASRILTPDTARRQLLILWGIAAIIGLSGRNAFLVILAAPWAPAPAQRRLRTFGELIGGAFIWGILGLAAVSTLRHLNAGPSLIDLAGSALVSLSVTVITVFAYLRYRRAVMIAVAGPAPRTMNRLRFAAAWPFIATAAAIGTLLALQISITVAHPLPGLPLLLTLLLALMAPHIETSLADWARSREKNASDSVTMAALYRTCRFGFILLALIAIGYQWAFPALTALGVNAGESEWRVASLALVALAAAWGWNLTGIGFERLTRQNQRSAGHETDAHAPRTRLETLFPLLGGTGRAIIVLIALLTILLLLGMNVWPIITGLSVFGLAISFGSQTLVKDIVSGLFFLIDDAFRMGEYIETSGAKGTVERISVRSVSLRHPRGAIATVPYGQIGKIQNFSRDWVILKLVFRVAFDTDVEKVRKLFKKIGAELAADPDIADDLLETFKSQGIASVEDGTLLVRGKFMARAGKQFVIRRKVFLAVQQGFRENGIVAVPKPMMMAGMPVAAPAATNSQEGPVSAPAPTSAEPPPQPADGEPAASEVNAEAKPAAP